MKITVKMPTGEFLKDDQGNQQLDENNKPIPLLKDKDFTAPFIPARKLKNTIAMGNKIVRDAGGEESFDSMAEYIADIYGKQFTADNALDGLSSVDLINEFTNCVTIVTGGLDTKVKELAETSPNE